MNSKKFGGKKFERKKVRLFRRFELFSARTFFLIPKNYLFKKNWWKQVKYWQNTRKTGLGKKFERKKVRIGEKVELFSIRTFFLNFFWVYMEAIGLQKWQTTHFKAYSKWWRMDYLNLTNSFDKVQKNFSELSFWNWKLTWMHKDLGFWSLQL